MERNSLGWEQFKEMRVGSSKVGDDIWDLTELMTSKVVKDCHKKVRFSYIKFPNIKNTVKRYAFYKLGKAKASTVISIVNGRLPSLVSYMEDNGMESFSDFGRSEYMGFIRYLKEEKKISRGTGAAVSGMMEDMFNAGRILGWDVPSTNIFRNLAALDVWGKRDCSNKTKPIPEDIYNRILYHALNDEKDVRTKAGIIIQSQTGLRIGEVLSIRDGCVGKTDEGDYYLEVDICKTEKGGFFRHKVFVNSIVAEAVSELSEKTKTLRTESGMDELFLTRSNRAITVIKAESWSHRRLRSFVKRHDIRDSSGELYFFHSHQFRATFVRELVKQKVPIAMIMKQYAHVSIEMTSHYLTLQEKEIRDVYAEMVLSPDSQIAGLRAGEIKEKLADVYRGKTAAEISGVISGLADTMSFNPLPTGVCLYDFRRGNCTDGDGCFFYNCPNFITDVQFYPVLKKELELLEMEMARLMEAGRVREWQKHHIKHKYLKPLVQELEDRMNGKEEAV